MFIKLKVLTRNGEEYQNTPIFRFNISKITRYAEIKGNVNIWVTDSDAIGHKTTIDTFIVEATLDEVDAQIQGAEEKMARLLYGAK